MLKDLVSEVKTKFSDLITDPSAELFLQLKHEAWGGEFVDIDENQEVADKSVIKVVVEPKACQVFNEYTN